MALEGYMLLEIPMKDIAIFGKQTEPPKNRNTIDVVLFFVNFKLLKCSVDLDFREDLLPFPEKSPSISLPEVALTCAKKGKSRVFTLSSPCTYT